MEYRRRTAKFWSWCQIHARNPDQLDCAETACQSFHWHTFCWRKVGPVFQSRQRHIAADRITRFLPPSVAEKYNLDIPDYKGVDQVAEVGVSK